MALKATIDKILIIVDEQVDRLQTKSSKQKLTEDDVNMLSTLSDIAVKINEKVKFKQPRSNKRGAHLSDDDITKYAKGD